MSVNPFAALGVCESLCKALARRGIKSPTPMQAAFLPLYKNYRDTTLVLRDQTGTGKTFGLAVALANEALIEQAKSTKPIKMPLLKSVSCTSLVLVPNRYLAAQLANWLKELTVDAAAIDGRQIQPENIVALGYRGNPSPPVPGTPLVLVTTATNAIEMYEKGILDITSVSTVMLDEIDQLIPPLPSADSKAAISHICSRLRHAKPAEIIVSRILEHRASVINKTHGAVDIPTAPIIRFVMASASVGRSVVTHVREALGWLQGAPVRVVDATGVGGGVLPAKMRHRVLCVPDDCFDTPRVLSAYLAHFGIQAEKVLVAELSDRMTNGRWRVYASRSVLHSDFLKQLFKNRKDDLRAINGIRVLEENVSRGIDIPDAKHVILMAPPANEVEYLHLAGRVARMGQEGTVTTIVPRGQKAHIEAILLTLNAKDVVELPAAVGELFGENNSITDYAERNIKKGAASQETDGLTS